MTTKMPRTRREGSAEGLGPATLSMSPFAGGAPGRSLKRLPSLYNVQRLYCTYIIMRIHCQESYLH